jgi:hypothetical protein
VKPLRGKRTELGESVVVIQPVRSRAPVHLAAAERDDRPSGRLKPVGKVAARLRAVLQAVAVLADWRGLGPFAAPSVASATESRASWAVGPRWRAAHADRCRAFRRVSWRVATGARRLCRVVPGTPSDPS